MESTEAETDNEHRGNMYCIVKFSEAVTPLGLSVVEPTAAVRDK